MKHLHILPLLILTFFFFATAPSLHAASPTPTPTSSISDAPIASSSQEITDDVVEKIKAVVKNSPSPSLNNTLVGLVGMVKTLTNNSLTLITENQTLQIVTDTNTSIVSNGKPSSLKDIAVDSKVIVIGSVITSDDIYLAKRIIIVSPTPAPATLRSVIFGTIKKIDTAKKSITVTTTNQTDIVIGVTSKSNPSLSEFTLKSLIVAIIKTDTKTKTSSLIIAKPLQ